MIFNKLLTSLYALLLMNAVFANNEKVYDELLELLEELEKDSETDGGKRETLTTRDDSQIKSEVDRALTDAKIAIDKFNDRKIFYYNRGGNLDAFETIQQSAGNDYRYTLLSSPGCAAEAKSVIFDARACSDVHVGLKVDEDPKGDLYEIVIGGWSNTQSAIRTEKQGNNLVEVKTDDVLDCDKYITFMVGWASGHIQVFKLTGQSGWNEFMSWYDPNIPVKDVKFVGLTTANWTSGYFRTPKQGDDAIIDTHKQFNVYNYTLLQDHGFPLVQRPYVVFEVKTCNDAYIGLSKAYDQGYEDVEIVIGTDLNTRSAIRINDTDQAFIDLADVVDCDKYTTFFISWADRNIQVFRQTTKGWTKLMTYTYGGPEIPINFIGFSTKRYASGSWRISKTFETGLDAPPGDSSPEALAGLNNVDTDKTEIEKEEHAAVMSLAATKLLLDRGVFKDLQELKANKIALELWKTFFNNHCDEGASTSCSSNNPYRTITGECNNLDNPRWGAINTVQVRLVLSAYDNKFSSPRKTSVSGSDLPSARTVSRTVFKKPDGVSEAPTDPLRSLMMMVWGQILDHDIGETPISKGFNGVTIQCCSIIDVFVRKEREQCFPIPIDPQDPIFTRKCMNFIRSSAATAHHCEPGERDQLNVITSFIDGSMVYGSEDHVAHSLRTFHGGKMKVDPSNLLPKNDDSACVLNQPGTHCFLAGDIRVNENALLASMHTVLIVYHNILAERLSNLANNTLDDDEIYERARQIIGALIQQITYSKWLPNVLGSKLMTYYKLDLGMDVPYDKTVNPGAQLAFTTGAMRYGHTLVLNDIPHMSEDGQDTGSNPLSENFFVTNPVFSDAKGLVSAMYQKPCGASDGTFADAIENHLFENKGPFGLDLSALNIQRGRDHGLPGYISYLKLCFDSQPGEFSELYNHDAEAQELLKKVYSDVEDIDLFAGGMTEKNVEGGHVGGTFGCLLGKQFQALKEGDRFWYQNSLNRRQKRNVDKVSLSKILCETFKLDEVPEDPFLLSDERTKCSELDDIDLKHWL
ncbi:lactoperoxidase-like [Ylistrum balloti]|uniref:lactoperoxidase-like n=1 Tax=Ylistrum balloti TaxID=509963 RepID=UPI002905D673|nr:lactoperoxidase-like [Ylistrum balloti]